MASVGFHGFPQSHSLPHLISISFSVRYHKPFSRFRQGLRYRPEVCHIRYGTCHSDITARFVLLKGSVALESHAIVRITFMPLRISARFFRRNLPIQG